jgi:hypothetical protein
VGVADGTLGFDNIGVFVPDQALTNWITGPTEGSTNPLSGFEITARAVVSPGSVTNVIFLDNGSPIGSDSTFPYSLFYTNPTVGNRTLTVQAQDDQGGSQLSAAVNIVVEDFTPPPSAPTNDAPVPLRPASQVVALYNSSSTYPLATVNPTWYIDWGATGGSDYTIPETGSSVINWNNLLFSGFVNDQSYTPGNELDAGDATHLHLDVWSTANQLEIKMVSEQLGVGGTKFEQAIFLAPTTGPVPGALTNLYTWNSVDIPLTAWTDIQPSLDFSEIIQIIWANTIDNGGILNGDFFLDNVYFYNTTPAIQNIAQSGGNFTVEVFGEDGSTYQLQGTPTLTPPAWSNVGSPQAGTGGTLIFSTPVGTGNQYFRVQQN